MNKIEVPVTANIGDIQKKLEALGKTVEKASRVKWTPLDVKAIERDITRVERRLGDVGARSPDAPGRREVTDRIRRSIRQRYTYSPEFGDIGRQFIGSVGGPAGQIASYGARGATAGAVRGAEGGGAAGGLAGGALGLLKGLGIGAAIAAVVKIGQAATEGYDMAKDRAFTLDSLKRQMGDLGVSFDRLKEASNNTAYTLGINSKDFAVVMADFNKLSRGADKTPEELGADAATSVGFARAYGMDPNQSNQFFGAMKGTDQRQQSRELALMLAEAINRSRMGANAEAVMQAVQSFASLTSRMNLTPANTSAYLGAYSDMMDKNPNMTPDAAQTLLGTADANFRNFGSGEGGNAFMLAAMNRGGYMNPIEAQAQAQGGLFASKSSMFGAGTPMGNFFGKEGQRIAGGKNADETNIERFMEQLRAVMGNNKTFIMGGLMRQLGMTGSQASALYNMQSGGMHLGTQLKAAGIDPSSIKDTAYQQVAEVAGAKSGKDLMHIAQSLLGNKNLSEADRGTIQGALASPGQDNQDLRMALLRIAANTDQEGTSATAARDAAATLEKIQTSLGDHMFEEVTAIKDAAIKSAFGGPQGYVDYKSQQIDEDLHTRNDAIHLKYADAQRKNRHHGDASSMYMDPAERSEIEASNQEAAAERQGLLHVTGTFTLQNKDGSKAAPDVSTNSTIKAPQAVH